LHLVYLRGRLKIILVVVHISAGIFLLKSVFYARHAEVRMFFKNI